MSENVKKLVIEMLFLL